MQQVCRHCFVTEDMVSRAYEDYPLPLHSGQTISQPYIVALMSELAALTGTERVLEIGTGSGYQTAVLAELAAEVDTIEILPELTGGAKDKLGRLGYKNINFRTGDGALGWAERAPYDAIVVTCAAAAVPAELTEQLKPGGRLVIPVGREGEQDLRLITKTAAGLKTRTVCSVRFVPMVAGK
jgi:protein-L-isoaspartate(D-aspartate) O-methyltransferase